VFVSSVAHTHPYLKRLFGQTGTVDNSISHLPSLTVGLYFRSPSLLNQDLQVLSTKTVFLPSTTENHTQKKVVHNGNFLKIRQNLASMLATSRFVSKSRFNLTRPMMLMIFQPIYVIAFYFSSCFVSKSRFNLNRLYGFDYNNRFKQLKEQLLIPDDAKVSFPMYGNVLKPFVNCDDELKLTWQNMIEMYEKREERGEKPSIVFLDQMFGSGKTVFGLNLLNFNNKRVKKLFNANCPGKQCFKNVPTIHVDLKSCYYDFEPHTVIREGFEFDDYLEFITFYSTITKCFPGLFPPVKAAEPLLTFFQKNFSFPLESIEFLKYLLKCQSIYFFFDEINAIEHKSYDVFLSSDPNYLKDDLKKRQLAKYRKLWSLMTMLIQRGCFVFGAGHQLDYLGKQSYLDLTNSAGAIRLYLQFFGVNDITSILKESEARLDANYLEELSKFVHGLSSGIPRLTIKAIEFIKEFNNNSLKNVNSDQSFAKKILTTMKDRIGGAVPNYEYLPSSEKQLFFNLLRAVTSELSFKEHERLPSAGGYTVSELAKKFSFYVTKDGDDGIKLVMPWLWREFLNVQGLPFSLNIDPAYADKGKALERVFEAVVHMKTSLKDISCRDCFPFLRGTTVGKIVIPWTTKRYEFPPESRFLNNRTNQFRLLKMIKNESSTLIIPSPISHFPDLTLLFKDESNLNYSVMFQLRNYEDGDSINGDVIMEEYKKTKYFTEFYDLAAATFVFVSASGVQQSLERFVGRIISSTSDTSDFTYDDVLSDKEQESFDTIIHGLSDKVNLLILSEMQLQELIGEINLTKLKDLSV
jgi:hypothetical protein